jgi:hypothetical protein
MHFAYWETLARRLDRRRPDWTQCGRIASFGIQETAAVVAHLVSCIWSCNHQDSWWLAGTVLYKVSVNPSTSLSSLIRVSGVWEAKHCACHPKKVELKILVSINDQICMLQLALAPLCFGWATCKGRPAALSTMFGQPGSVPFGTIFTHKNKRLRLGAAVYACSYYWSENSA